MGHASPERPPRFCPHCGAPAKPGLSHCTVCGRPLTDPDELARLWGHEPGRSPFDDTEVIDLYPELDPSLQTTTPYTQTRPFNPADYAEPAPAKAVDPWSAAGGTLSGQGLEAPPPAAAETARSGPPGVLLGCLAILLIAAVGALLSWGAVRSFVSDRIEHELSVGIGNQLRGAGPITPAQSGRLRLTEERLNTHLDRTADSYQPIANPSVSIQPGQVAIAFELYGVSSTYRCGLAVQNGRIVVVDPSVGGPLGRIVDAEDLGDVFEAEVAELFRRSGLEPTAISVRDGSIVVTLAPAA